VNTTDDSRLYRRSVLRGALGLAFAAITTREAEAQQKNAQSVVQYQDKPHDGKECRHCLHFVPPDSCKLVAGKISPMGWCLLFAPKPS